MIDRQVRYTSRSKRQLESLKSYITQASGRARADGFIESILLRCERIATVPIQGTALSDIGPNIRHTGFRNKVSIIFRVDPDTIIILAIAYGGRLIETSLRS